MTRTEIVRLFTVVAWLLAAAFLGAQRRIIRRLHRAAAADPASAVPLRVRSPIARFRLVQLQRAGAVVAAAPDRFYLDPRGYDSYQRARRRRGLKILAVALPVIALLWWLSARGLRI